MPVCVKPVNIAIVTFLQLVLVLCIEDKGAFSELNTHGKPAKHQSVCQTACEHICKEKES